MSEELKPCPFCGALDIDADAEDDYGRFYVCCMNCWSTASHFESKAEAIAAWNTRAPDLTERAAIVAWLRKSPHPVAITICASIEAGEHHDRG